MRIDRLRINGFGHFYQHEVGPLDTPLTVIFGANEAGKSTVLAFIRTVLFGFPMRNSDSHYPPLAGGRHGGHLQFTTGDGRSFIVQRYKGPRGGDCQVTAPDGTRLDAAGLSSLMGHASSDLFQSVFAFSLDELQDIKSLSGNEVSGRIYSAGMGASRLPRALQELENNEKAIFAARGRNHRIAEVLSELQDVETKLANVVNQAAEYGHLTERHAAVEQNLAGAARRRAESSSRSHDLDRLLRACDEWEPLRKLGFQLKEMPRYENFPEEAVARIDALQRQIRDMGPDLREAQAQLEKAEKLASAEVPDEALGAEKETIETIRRGRGSFDASVRDLPERGAELREMEKAFASNLQLLGPGWAEDRLQNFDTSVTRRDEVEQWGKALVESENAVRQQAVEVIRAERELADAVEARQEADARLEQTVKPSLDTAAPEQSRRWIRSTRSRLAEFTQAQQRRQDLESQLRHLESQPASVSLAARTLPVLPVFLFVGGLAALLAGLVLEGQEVALVLGAVLLAAGAVTFVKTRHHSTPGTEIAASQLGSLQQLAERARQVEEEARTALREAARPLGFELPNNDGLDEAEEKLHADQDALDTWTSVSIDADDAAREAKRTERHLEEAKQARQRAVDERDAHREKWRAWLRHLDLPETLTPETVTELFERIRTARVEHSQVTAMRQRVNAIREDIDEYRQLVEPVAVRYQAGAAGLEHSRLAPIADALIERLDNAGTKVAERDNARKVVDDARRNLTRLKDRLGTLQEEEEQLIKDGGAIDSEELRRRAAQDAERRELERQQGDHKARLQNLCRPTERLEDLTNALEHASIDALKQEVEAVNSEISKIDERREELREEQGRIASRIETLAGEGESSALRLQKEMLIEQLRKHAGDWSRLALAQTLMQRTRRKYEQERQPGVIRHAEEFFKTITSGRYQRVRVPLDGLPDIPTIQVIDPNDVAKGPEELSRGTREQLYLSLRFGLICEFGQHAEHLPVVADEVLVNFDQPRARGAAEAFARLSETNQVLVFTCHPQTVDVFVNAAPGSRVIELTTTS